MIYEYINNNSDGGVEDDDPHDENCNDDDNSGQIGLRVGATTHPHYYNCDK